MSDVEVRGLRKTYRLRSGLEIRAVRDVSLSIARGQTLALIGESGSGKSTVGRLLLRLLDADAGSIRVGGTEISKLTPQSLRAARRHMQIVFQEPFGSLNPRLRVGDIVEEPLTIHERSLTRRERHSRALAMLEEVGLDPLLASRMPANLSGGQQQRVGIARALVTRPTFVVLDEPTSSLDLSVQAQILVLLRELQTMHELSYLYISHDISTVTYIADRIAVMYLGEIREQGTVSHVVDHPEDPYTRALVSSALHLGASVRPMARTQLLPTDLDTGRRDQGCLLVERCPHRVDECWSTSMVLRDTSPGHGVRCALAPLPEATTIDARGGLWCQDVGRILDT